MPSLPKRLCHESGCMEYAIPGDSRCAKHIEAYRERMRERGRRADHNRDDTVRRLYRTERWRELRAWQLRREPFCAECEASGFHNIIAEVVDHITPHRGNPALFFDPDNLQSLCKSCHDSKTAREDGGFGRARKPRPGA